jgi:hypothetical protein
VRIRLSTTREDAREEINEQHLQSSVEIGI